MRSRHALVAGALALLALPAAAQEFKPPPFLAPDKPAPKPPKVDWNWRPSADWAQAARSGVVCGMTVIPADPRVDPKMRVAPPANGTTFTMTVVPPTVCRR